MKVFWAACLLLCAAVPGQVLGQKTRDPLSSGQADQVRELGTKPVDRIKLYLKFVNERAAAIRELTSNAGENNRPAELRARYEEFTRLTDELAENIDTYDNDKADIRKALRPVLSDCAKWPLVLKGPPPNPTYDFARRTALAAAASLTEHTQKLHAAEEAYFAQHKDQLGGNGRAPTPE